MTTPRAKSILQHLRRLAAHLEELSDRELLHRFASQHDEEAFARLMRRHRPLVQGVGLRVLGNWHDSEDVTQAVFLVLARKAASPRWHDSVACWLYRVAYHLALKAKAASNRRQSKERQAVGRAAADAFDDIRLSEARTLLDEELATLPERYHAPILLCCLEAATQEEAARQLGCSLATLKRRLTKGRELLRVRLARRGLTLSAVLTPALLAPEPGAAAAMMLSNPSATARTLAEGALRAMRIAKLKIAAALVLTATMVTAGAGLVMQQVGSQPQTVPPPAVADAPQTAEVRKARRDCYGDDLPSGALTRLGTMRFRQGSWIYSLDLSPDGRKLITVGANNRLHLWDVATGKEMHHFPDDQRSNTTYAAAFSPDGRTFATGGNFGFSLWQTSTGKRLRSVEWFRVFSLAFAPDGRTLATGALEKGPALWNAASGEKIAQLEEQGAGTVARRDGLHSLAFAPNGRLLASTYGSGVILWDVAKRKEIRRLERHDKSVHTTAFSSDGKLLASGGEDKTIRLWEASTGRELGQLQGHQATVTSLVFSADGKTLISGSGGSPIFPGTTERKALRLWDVDSGEERGAIDEQRCDSSSCFLALSRDGKLLIAVDGGCVRLWDPATRKEIRPLGGHRHWIGSIAFAPDGKRLATAGGDCTVRLWDATTGRPLWAIACGDEPADSVVFSPDGRTIASSSRDGILRLWDAGSGREIRRILGHQARQTYVAFSPDGTRLASASRDATAAIWDVATGKEVRRFKGEHDGYLCVAFSPDGKRIAAGELYGKLHMQRGKGPDAARPLVRVWDIESGIQIHALKGHTNIMIPSIAFSPDGAILASTGWDKTTRLWDMATGTALDPIVAGGKTIAFSPDGRMIATGDSDGKIRLWETMTRKERARFTGRQASIQGLAFSPDGRILASASMDSTALLWDVRGLGRPDRPIDGKKCWQALADVDAVKAYRAIAELIADPKQTVPLLRQHLRPVHSPDPERLARLVAELENERFEVREKAQKQIEEIGELAKPDLQKALGGKPSLEVRRRVEVLLLNIDPAHSPAQLRALRAVEVLEHLGTPEARRVLETLGSGAAEARLTRESKASLTRLTR